MGLIPLHDKVLVKPVKPEEVSSGGIIIPDTAKEKPVQGEVIAVGSGRVNDDGTVIPPSVFVGDTIVYAKYGGTELNVDGSELLIIKESDILAIIKN
jgi:chaperonin GroES